MMFQTNQTLLQMVEGKKKKEEGKIFFLYFSVFLDASYVSSQGSNGDSVDKFSAKRPEKERKREKKNACVCITHRKERDMDS